MKSPAEMKIVRIEIANACMYRLRHGLWLASPLKNASLLAFL